MTSVKSADRALDILLLLGGKVRPVPAAAIARACGLPRSSAYALLNAMAAREFVAYYAHERAWGLGAAALALGSPARRAEPLAWLARPLLTALARETGATAELTVVDGDQAVCVLVDGPGDPAVPAQPGVRLPAQLTAAGRAVLMHAAPAQLRALFPPGRPPSAALPLACLEAELAAARAAGHVVLEGARAPGVLAVAAPVFGSDGRVAAAIGVSAGPARALPAGRGAVAAAVRVAAATLSERLGGPPAAARAAAA